MKFKAFANTILAVLGLSAWTTNVDGKNSISEDQAKTLEGFGFTPKFLDAFKASLENDFKDDDSKGSTQHGKNDGAESTTTAILRGLLAETSAKLVAAADQLETMKQTTTTNASALETKAAEIVKLQAKIKALSDASEIDPGKGKQHTPGATDFNVQDDKQLGGLEGDMFALDRPYNVRARAKMLEAAGVYIGTPTANSMDYSRLKEDLGAFYRIPWQTRLQSFIMLVPSIESIFPLESGYQDLAVLVNIWLGEFSQSGNEESDFDKVTKGAYDFDDETLRMYNVMFAHRFKNLKALEKSWIGSLNKEGSNAIKWSFIEYILAETAKKLHNEREQRRINGIRKDPDLNKPGKAMEAADGLFEYLSKKVNGYIDINNGKTVYQLKPFILGEISEANIGEKIYQGTAMIPAVLRDSGSIALYMPSHFIVLYHKYNEIHYGQNQDYKGNLMYVKEYPSVKIIPIPNADSHHRIFWTMEGNIRTFEDKPNEMINFSMEQEDWSLKVWSSWRESIAAMAVGYKYIKKADMDYSRQMIFLNEYDRPSTYFVESEKDENPSAKFHSSIVTVPNTSELVITEIDDAEIGAVISLKCGAEDKGVKIEKTAKFENITVAWNPKKGDVIKLMKRADGKFIEIARITGAADALQFGADEVKPSLAEAEVFVTGENSEEIAILDFLDAEVGVVYTIHGNGLENTSKIENGGNFVITGSITLKTGTFIKLVKSENNKFYEVQRNQ